MPGQGQGQGLRGLGAAAGPGLPRRGGAAVRARGRLAAPALSDGRGAQPRRGGAGSGPGPGCGSSIAPGSGGGCERCPAAAAARSSLSPPRCAGRPLSAPCCCCCRRRAARGRPRGAGGRRRRSSCSTATPAKPVGACAGPRSPTPREVARPRALLCPAAQQVGARPLPAPRGRRRRAAPGAGAAAGRDAALRSRSAHLAGSSPGGRASPGAAGHGAPRSRQRWGEGEGGSRGFLQRLVHLPPAQRRSLRCGPGAGPCLGAAPFLPSSAASPRRPGPRPAVLGSSARRGPGGFPPLLVAAAFSGLWCRSCPTRVVPVQSSLLSVSARTCQASGFCVSTCLVQVWGQAGAPCRCTWNCSASSVFQAHARVLYALAAPGCDVVTSWPRAQQLQWQVGAVCHLPYPKV